MSLIASMTGFAAADGTAPDGRTFSLTIKSVNHRHLDLALRLPQGFDALEEQLRKRLKTGIRRGHVELTLIFAKAAASTSIEIDEPLLARYIAASKQAAAAFNLKQEPDLGAIFRMPGVITSAAAPQLDPDALTPAVLTAADLALERFHAARTAEGAALATELRACMHRIATMTEEARKLREGAAEAEFRKLSTRLRELLADAPLSDERLLTEAALLVARSDVDEELVRLRTHIHRFLALLDQGGETGRPLDFLLQEFNREANTLLSKTGAHSGDNSMRLTDLGLAIKVELERAREQVQNLE